MKRRHQKQAFFASCLLQAGRAVGRAGAGRPLRTRKRLRSFCHSPPACSPLLTKLARARRSAQAPAEGVSEWAGSRVVALSEACHASAGSKVLSSAQALWPLRLARAVLEQRAELPAAGTARDQVRAASSSRWKLQAACLALCQVEELLIHRHRQPTYTLVERCSLMPNNEFVI
jgi:hypothetical protein